MKPAHKFTLFIVGFLILMFLIRWNLPRQFVWYPTFSHKDSQPLGMMLTDSLFASSLPLGYAVTGKTLYQMEREDTAVRRNLLVVSEYPRLSEADQEALFRFLKRGNKVMLVGSAFPKHLRDTMGFEDNYETFGFSRLRWQAEHHCRKDSIVWTGDSLTYGRRAYYYYPEFTGNGFDVVSDTLPYCPYAWKMGWSVRQDTTAVHLTAFSRPVGEGEVYFVSAPLLFTNYGMLENPGYLLRLMDRLKDRPVVRLEAYTAAMEHRSAESHSPLGYVKAHAPLRWAFYGALFLIVLSIGCNARRRQRAIPVLKRPQNRTLEFVELIGTLYYQKRCHTDLVRKKYLFFAEELRRAAHVDLSGGTDREELCRTLARKAGMEEEKVVMLFRDLEPLLGDDPPAVSEEQMKSLVDRMNEIINHL